MGAAMFNAQRIVLAVLTIFLVAAVIRRQTASYPPQPPIRQPNSVSPQAEDLEGDSKGGQSRINSPKTPEETPKTSEQEKKEQNVHQPGRKVVENDCGDLPGIEDIVLVLKTGATEIYEKTPIFWTTTFTCGADYIVYSDLGQDLGRTVVRDALALTTEDLREKSYELEQYRSLRDHFKSGGSALELKGNKNWEIDKFKFLPMISDAYHTFGDRKKWFVFIEADTYISLHNLLLWLGHMDPARPIYGGAQIFIGETEFAHGGSGFIMSTPAARALTETYEADRAGWEEKLKDECCGDKLMAEVLIAANPRVDVLRAFPIIQGETPASLDWSDLHWCRPAVSWHHVDATAIDALWQFERKWRSEKGASTPIRFGDYYAAFVKPRLEAADWRLEGWDNLSDRWRLSHDSGDEESRAATRDADACQAFCESQWDCLQWVWSPGSCRANGVVRLGWALTNRPALGSADDRIFKADQAVSGWFPDRIDEYHAEFRCDDDLWIVKSI